MLLLELRLRLRIRLSAAAGVEVEAEVEAGIEVEVAVAASAMAVDRVRMPERTTKGSWRQAEAWGTHCSVRSVGTRIEQMLSSGKTMGGPGVSTEVDPGTGSS